MLNSAILARETSLPEKLFSKRMKAGNRTTVVYFFSADFLSCSYCDQGLLASRKHASFLTASTIFPHSFWRQPCEDS